MRHLWVDASWQKGLAGIAVTNLAGVTIASEVIKTATPANAEFKAVRLAKKIANERGWLPVTIYTDFTSATHPANTGPANDRFVIEWRPRHENQAHLEAGRVRRAHANR